MKLFKFSDKIEYKGGVNLKYRFKEVFKKYNVLKYVSYMLIVVAVGVIILAFLPNKKAKYSSAEVVIRNTESEVLETATNATASNEASSEAKSVRTFVKNGYPNINVLVGRYYDALMSNDDKKLSKYTDSVENIDPLKRKINAEYIESYQNLDCYTMPGMVEGTYIVAALYQLKYKNISTVTPYFDCYYVCTDLSGNIYITNKPVSDEISAYNQLMYESNTIRELAQHVASEYDAALKNDEQLAEFVKNLQQ